MYYRPNLCSRTGPETTLRPIEPFCYSADCGIYRGRGRRWNTASLFFHRGRNPAEQLAVAAEARGFDALFVPEHTHIPTSRRSPYIGGGDIPPEYLRIPDPFIALAGAAPWPAKSSSAPRSAWWSSTIRSCWPSRSRRWIGCASGRFIFGVGAGWNAEEMANHGTDFKTRWKLLRERVAR